MAAGAARPWISSEAHRGHGGAGTGSQVTGRRCTGPRPDFDNLMRTQVGPLPRVSW